jgi:hypothetical protein
MDDHIGLVFPGQAFGFVDGRLLKAVFGGDPLVPLTPYGPPALIGYHVLVPGPSLFALATALKKGLHQFAQKVYPRIGFFAFGHVAFFLMVPKILFSTMNLINARVNSKGHPPWQVKLLALDRKRQNVSL